MENFVVSARKYRPTLFDSVVGQVHITTTLQNAIRTNHLAQAFLFCGPRGVGKTTCARILAKTINCQNLGDEVEACGECDSCKSFSTNSSFNIFELDAASNNSVDDIRNLIDQVRFPPQQGKYKIYIIDEVHMLSTAAFNAFLKTLEEPPSYAIFILATTEKHKILPTILSRCQIFDFNRIKNNDISEHLEAIAAKENIAVERAALDLIAQKADGGLRDALSMFDLNVTFSAGQTLGYQQVLENLHILDYDYYFKIVDALFEGNLTVSLLIFNEIIAKGFDGHQFVVGLNEHYRNLMVSKDPQTLILLEVSASVEQKFAEQAKLLPLHYIYSALSIGSQLDLNYKAAKAQKLHVEIGLMKISQLGNLFDLNQLVAVEVEKKNDLKPQIQQIEAVSVSKVEEPAFQPMPTREELGQLKYETKKVGGFKSSKLASSDSFEIVEQSKTDSNKSSSADEQKTFENRPFNQNQLLHAWSDFMKTRTLAMEQVMLDRDFKFENNQIAIVFDNDVQMQQFDQMKQELMNFLRLKLHNNTFTIEAVQGKYEAKERLPYTAQEKYDFLLRKNPNVAKLKEKFNLELSH